MLKRLKNYHFLTFKRSLFAKAHREIHYIMTPKNKGGRPKKSNKNKRLFQVKTYLNKTELEALEELENTYNFSTAELLRLALYSFGLEVENEAKNTPVLSDKNTLEIKKELSKIGTNLNQIAKQFNTFKTPSTTNFGHLEQQLLDTQKLLINFKNDM